MFTDLSAKISNLSQQEREEFIKAVYKLILNRDPTDRELQNYKYSLYTKWQVIKKLLESEEHKKLLENGSKFEKTKENLQSLEDKVRELETVIETLKKEHQALSEILQEKNRHIQQLREHLNTVYLTLTKSLEKRAHKEPYHTVAGTRVAEEIQADASTSNLNIGTPNSNESKPTASNPSAKSKNIITALLNKIKHG